MRRCLCDIGSLALEMKEAEEAAIEAGIEVGVSPASLCHSRKVLGKPTISGTCIWCTFVVCIDEKSTTKVAKVELDGLSRVEEKRQST